MNTALLLLVLTGTFIGIKSWTLETDSGSNYHNVKNFRWITDAYAIESFSHLAQLHFINATIDTVTQSFENQLENCVWLKFTGGKVKTVYINSKLSMIHLQNTSTERVIIEPGKEYILGMLVIRSTKLTRIPQNINQLKQINRIDIIDNWIESVSLHEFEGLNNLYEINLSGNRLKRIDSNGGISFPSLFRLKLQNNYLERLDTCNWKMPKLYELLLNNNSLAHFAFLHFNQLGQLTLASNPLNCAWINSLVSQRPQLVKDEYTCDVSNQDELIGLHCPPTLEESKQQNVNEKPILNRRVQELEMRLFEQNNLMNDIIETIYRMEVEKAVGYRKNAHRS